MERRFTTKWANNNSIIHIYIYMHICTLIDTSIVFARVAGPGTVVLRDQRPAR